ncbi:MAG: HAMP domain-containing histidine kinase [Candidatus Binataceae bacterium]|nr:HAMP domain-containing histidine kinase [Candidatus Binataceae bacterium]
MDANRAGLQMIESASIGANLDLRTVIDNPAEELDALLRDCAGTRSPILARLVWRTPHGQQAYRSNAWCARPASEQNPALVAIQCQLENSDDSLLPNDQLNKLKLEIAKRQRSEAELANAIQARDEFVAVAAHELRNPLNLFHLTLQLLYRIADEPGAQPRIRGILEKSRTQLARLIALVDRLLDVARLRSGRFELHRETFDLGELVKEAVSAMIEQQPKASISLGLEPAVIGTWDKIRIDEAVTNLLSNAVKYGMGNAISVTLSSADGEAILTVTDHGFGMSPEALKRIFDQFERAVPQTEKEGLGLGLWITKMIVDAHHGSISAISEPGSGSAFTLRLPLDRSRQIGDR